MAASARSRGKLYLDSLLVFFHHNTFFLHKNKVPGLISGGLIFVLWHTSVTKVLENIDFKAFGFVILSKKIQDWDVPLL